MIDRTKKPNSWTNNTSNFSLQSSLHDVRAYRILYLCLFSFLILIGFILYISIYHFLSLSYILGSHLWEVATFIMPFLIKSTRREWKNIYISICIIYKRMRSSPVASQTRQMDVRRTTRLESSRERTSSHRVHIYIYIYTMYMYIYV